MEELMAKPRTAAGYDATHVTKVREACLYLATKVGDLLGELVIVGGLVPSLIVDQRREGLQRHIGTLDLDVGMEVAILEEGRYAELTARLRAAGFGPDTNERGNITRQRWKIDGPPKVTLDFLIAPTRPDDEGGHLRNLQDDFAAVIAPGLRLAFRDSKTVRLAERTIRGERAERSVLVCGAGAFVVMKALAFRNRGENKDAYDLSYVVRNYGEGVGDVAGLLAPLMEDLEAQKAVGFLREDFAAIDSLGPRRVSEFLFDARHDEEEGKVWSAVQDLLRFLDEKA
ncbi:MAG: hypothetical protein ABSE49_22930 [Polyangiaceae bacterium]